MLLAAALFLFFCFPSGFMYGSFHTGISEIPGLSIYYKIYQAKMSDDKLLSVTQAYNSIFSVLDFSQQRLFFHFPPFPWPFSMSYERGNTPENTWVQGKREYGHTMGAHSLPYPSQMSMHSKVSIEKAQLNQTAAICTFYSSAVQEHLLARRQRNISK